MWIVTVVVSLAVPLNDGVVSLDGEAGDLSVPAGDVVLTVKHTLLLVPAAFPSALCPYTTLFRSCLPASSAGLAGDELQPPPVPVAVALETTGPSALLPA